MKIRGGTSISEGKRFLLSGVCFFLSPCPPILFEELYFFLEEYRRERQRERKGQGDYFSSFFYFVSFPCAGSNPIMLISNFHPFDSDFHGIGGRQGEGETWLYGRQENRFLLIPNNFQRRPLENELRNYSRGNRFSLSLSSSVNLIIYLTFNSTSIGNLLNVARVTVHTPFPVAVIRDNAPFEIREGCNYFFLSCQSSNDLLNDPKATLQHHLQRFIEKKLCATLVSFSRDEQKRFTNGTIVDSIWD